MMGLSKKFFKITSKHFFICLEILPLLNLPCFTTKNKLLNVISKFKIMTRILARDLDGRKIDYVAKFMANNTTRQQLLPLMFR